MRPSYALRPVPVPLDQARLLPRVRVSDAVDRFEMERRQGLALVEGLDREPSAAAPRRVSFKAEPGDLRGIPVVGFGVGGVSPGSKPGSDASLARCDRERERRAA